MNKSNFVQTEGYPLNAERLQELQTSFSIFNALGNLAGNLAIISGCETVGTTVKNGVVFVDGEVLEFREGSVNANSRVVVIEEKINKTFKSGVSKEVYTVRYATFGTASTSWAWSDFKRGFQTKDLQAALDLKEAKTTVSELAARIASLEKKNAVFQAGGGVVLWNKPANQIPAGWREVEDLRGLFPVGFDSSQVEFNTMGKWGGAKIKTLTVNEMPRHSHSVASQTGGDNSDHSNKTALAGGDKSPQEAGFNFTSYTSQEGSGQAFSILNPYRVVMFIEYVG